MGAVHRLVVGVLEMTASADEQKAILLHHRNALDDAVREGNFDRACAEAKVYATVMGLTGAGALVALVESVERVVGK